ncbi:uncharacterized protein [Rutidosis leptorrhynchoides]|uniref:uncharacterized protein isoform X2 n=1 Tax=Rutidosis leptorrhynchoides TaxID=125765 RepID=UPI003A9A2D6A
MELELALGFQADFGKSNYKLVPWISWDDWCFVRDSLFSSASPHLALQRISAWRSRGCLPVVIEVTASIVEIQQKDPFYSRDSQTTTTDIIRASSNDDDDMLTMLYCMTIMRLVNGIVEKTRKKNEVSIGEAADAIGIPRMLIDIRHECSHRDLPSLRLVRLASTKALDWLKANYWEPQKMAIPCPSDRTATKKVKSKIRELAFSLDVKQATRSGSSVVKEKRSKKDIKKALKSVVKLYSSLPLEVVSILLKFLLKAQEYGVHTVEFSDSSRAVNNSQADDNNNNNSQLDDWKPLIIKLSNKVPDMLLSLLKAVIQMIEAGEALKPESGQKDLKPEHTRGFHQAEHLPYLFNWLVGILKDLKRKIPSTDTISSQKENIFPKSSLIHLLKKCASVSSSLGSNNHLATAVSALAQQTCNHTLVHKLTKLASLHTTPNTDTVSIIEIDPASFYNQQEKCLNEAAKKFEYLTQKLSQKSNSKTTKNNRRWSVVKSWNPCPIGMLPSDVGSSGVVPVLDVVEDQNEHSLEEEDEEARNDKCEVNDGSRANKREADCPLEVLDDSSVNKKLKEDGCVVEDSNSCAQSGVNNVLMIGGVWKRVTEDEVISMASAIRILV